MRDSQQAGENFKPILNSEDADNDIRLTLLSDVTGISQSQLSRYLNGIDPMPIGVFYDLFDSVHGIYSFHNIDKIEDLEQLPFYLRKLLEPSRKRKEMISKLKEQKKT